ncbi:hypothetical protein ASU33_01910 [Solirubrum puertoriconensis]|uniref:Outer membrane protein beta-barrel domain-containing protein n=1 Tax=Solirubrum puertoriconensis TaxID=1751427 RepID=A0A9X0HHU5_SOLP1|nr:hypothetical protein ASU33_01910 [Solirubrum puertoriconensis]
MAGLLCWQLPSVAQTEKGSKLIGLSVGDLNYERPNNGYSTLSARFMPSAGVFVLDNLALGAGLDLAYSRYQFGQASNASFSDRTLQYGLAPFARYYFLGSERHKLFGQLTASASHISARRVTESSAGEKTPTSKVAACLATVLRWATTTSLPPTPR